MLGKFLGGGIGFLLGGPLGALIGVAFGHSIDSENQESNYNNQRAGINADTAQRQTAFFTLFIALCAKMIKADGDVKNAEVRMVKDFFSQIEGFTESDITAAKNILKESLKTDYSVYDLLQQWKTINVQGYQVNIELLNLLYRIAMADGVFHESEQQLINTVVSELGIGDSEHQRIKNLYVKNNDSDYKILGLEPGASQEQIKKAYRTLVSQYHPDKLISKGLPEDMIKFANEKMNKINEAYEKLRKK